MSRAFKNVWSYAVSQRIKNAVNGGWMLKFTARIKRCKILYTEKLYWEFMMTGLHSNQTVLYINADSNCSWNPNKFNKIPPSFHILWKKIHTNHVLSTFIHQVLTIAICDNSLHQDLKYNNSQKKPHLLTTPKRTSTSCYFFVQKSSFT